MRFYEFKDGLQRFVAQIRVTNGSSTITARTAIEAESVTHARALLTRQYGPNSVVFVSQTISEEEGAKVLSADEQRVKAMSDQAKRLALQAKQMKAQNAVKKAQASFSATLAGGATGRRTSH